MIATYAFATLGTLAAITSALTPQQERGRVIYQTGRSADGEIIRAVLADGAEPIDASLVPCSACHGDSGRGRPEGNVRPADIRAESLAHSLVSAERTRPAYTTAQRKRAITLGIDSAGHRLDRVMPRFQLTQDDAADLLAYLDVLGTFEPGVSDESVVINVVGASAVEAPADRIYGRKLVLQHDRRDGAFMTIDLSADGRASVEAAIADDMPTIVLATTVQPGKVAWIFHPPIETSTRGEAAQAVLQVVVRALNQLGREVHRDLFASELENLRADSR